MDRAEQPVNPDEQDAKPTDAKPADAKAGSPKKDPPKRRALPAHLRRVMVDVSDEQKQAMGDEWEQIGWETSEQLACQDREYFVKQILEREGIQIGYSTLCSYPIQLTERLEPLRELFYDYAARQPLWHLDETTLQVLDEPDRHARQKSYIGALRAGPAGAEVVIFHYDERRNYEALVKGLEHPLSRFQGAIISDEHKPYAKLASEYAGIEIRGGCWAHNRRKLTDTIKGRRSGSDAHKLIKDIATLYKRETKVQQTPY